MDRVASLYVEHVGEIRRFLTRRLHCVEAASELAHEAFVRFLAAAPSQPIANPRAFLFRIAGNLAIDHMRARPTAVHVDIDECTDLPSEIPSPERYAIARQQVECLRAAIAALPPKCREVFVRHKFDGVPHAQLATEFGVTTGAIEKQLVRALLQLRVTVLAA
jgi:RNA polymerase sigma factor (sigma-70 family)